MGAPLRIVQAAAFPFPTAQGSQVYVRGMARALARRGHAVTVACYAHGDGDVNEGYDIVRTPPVPGYRRVRAGPDPVKPALDLALAWRLAQIPADIVHAHNYEAPLAAAIARRWTGTPVVYCAHNTMAEELHTYFRAPWTRALAQRAGRALDAVVPRMADAAHVIHEPTAHTLRSLGCPRVLFVPPGVDPVDLRPAHAADLGPGPWVVYAGNPDAYQDLDVLYAALRQLPEVGLVVVSAADPAAWGGAAVPRIRVIQTADFEVVRSVLAAADVAALPRAVCSGYPIKLLNYLGMGLPTVAAAGSARDLPGVVVVPNRDAGAFAAALRGLLQDPHRRRALGGAARAHVLASCTWDRRAEELEGLYRDVLAAPRLGGAGQRRPQAPGRHV